MNNNYCDNCNYCNFCNYCDYSNYCESCDYSISCNFCKNLVNGFMCINLRFDKKDNSKYWIFNKEVTKEEWANRWNIGEELKSKYEQEVKND